MEDCEIISRENVRPSSPTPKNLRTYKLSLLDQGLPAVLVPALLYYHDDDKTESNDPDSFISETTQQLTRSLSAILTRYYPLAGRANGDGLSIDCSDQGVPFVVAKFRGQRLSDLVGDPGQNLRRKALLPCDVTKHADSSVALIQVNHFDCGGVAIAAVFWHRAADGPTGAAFLNSWAAVARGSREAVCPNYIFSSIFPQIEDATQIQSGYALAAALLKKGKSVLRRYVFDASAIATLKSDSAVERPTRVEVVSALIWKCFMAASLANNNSTSVMIHAINLRRRAAPPFPSDCFGNLQAMAAAASSNDDAKDLVRKMRESIGRIDGEYINRMVGDGGVSGYHQNQRRMWGDIPQGADCLFISSWCNLGFHGADFGWGKPGRVGMYSEGNNDSDSVLANGVCLVDRGDGDGIEAEMILDERYISVFENAHQLLLLASADATHH